jgi:hypothetical protein
LTFGVPGSKRNGRAHDLKQVSFTSLIAHPQENIGLSVSRISFFPHHTQIPASANILCPVKNRKSQFNFFTSTCICGTL